MKLVRAIYGDGGNRNGLVDRLIDWEERRIADMDLNGVDMHLLSLTAPGVQMFDARQGHRAGAHRQRPDGRDRPPPPDRFAGLGTFAPQDPARAAREIERCATELKLNGLVINSHTNDLYYDDPFFFPVFEAIEASGLALYIHPRALSKQIDKAFRDYGLDTAIWAMASRPAPMRCAWSSRACSNRFPRLKIVLGHMGEGIPFWLWRLDYMHQNAAMAWGRRAARAAKILRIFPRNFAITTSGVESHAALGYSVDVLGPENVMWAIDYPYQPTTPAVQFMRTAPLAEDVKAMVAGGNAARIFRIG
ncbi:MAG: amidohydrolase family protein [Sphingomonas sp.]